MFVHVIVSTPDFLELVCSGLQRQALFFVFGELSMLQTHTALQELREQREQHRAAQDHPGFMPS